MDKVIQDLEELTLRIVDDLTNASYEHLADFVEQRGAMIAKLREHQVSENDKTKYKEKIRRILAYDALILEKMTALKTEAKEKLGKINAGRKRMRVYNPAYTPDALFFDQKQ